MTKIDKIKKMGTCVLYTNFYMLTKYYKLSNNRAQSIDDGLNIMYNTIFTKKKYDKITKDDLKLLNDIYKILKTQPYNIILEHWKNYITPEEKQNIIEILTLNKQS